jgi:hypothetical protein
MSEGNPEDHDVIVWFVGCTASVPPSGTEQVSARRKDRLVAHQLSKCLVPRLIKDTRFLCVLFNLVAFRMSRSLPFFIICYFCEWHS